MPVYLTRQDLFKRGWTRKLIDKLLEVSAKTPNYSREGCLLNLYTLDNTLLAEKSKEFKEFLKKHRSTEDKLRSTLKWANGVEINFTRDISLVVLADSLDNFDGRELLAVIRHNFSNYNKLMNLCDERFFPEEAKRVIRLRLLRKLTKNYNALKEGASRQWEKWYKEGRVF